MSQVIDIKEYLGLNKSVPGLNYFINNIVGVKIPIVKKKANKKKKKDYVNLTDPGMVGERRYTNLDDLYDFVELDNQQTTTKSYSFSSSLGNNKKVFVSQEEYDVRGEL